eukprot:TRINITY_DN7149_c0_g1_i1.p1 TRINITY_DN7149_c0_g1~~TRINITY_DN7149_c0_g1_i1.p1  ORF type:complete len:1019 (-),score=170.08 TRINITY_DN7149_c0_g1_i1:149-3205(-)
MGKSKVQQVPNCRYGVACTRADCVFKHPPKPKKGDKVDLPKSDKVCFAFVAGKCVFGKQCHDKHPDEASCGTIRARYASIDCQWGRDCRSEGCLYRHPSDEVVGPALKLEPQSQQPAVYARGPVIASATPGGDAGTDAMRKAPSASPGSVPIPKAISQAADLRDASAFEISDPLDRFLAVNARNTGTQSAALLDLHFQTLQTFGPVLDEALAERIKMCPQGVWILASGAGSTRPQMRAGGVDSSGGMFDAVREYLRRKRYDFAVGYDADGQQRGAFFVRGVKRRREDPLEGVRSVFFSGLPCSGKSAAAEALAKKSQRFVVVAQDDFKTQKGMDDAFRQALSDAVAHKAMVAKKAVVRFWDHDFNAEKHYLAIPIRMAALAFLRRQFGIALPQTDFLHAMVAFLPSSLDLRAHLGRVYRVSFRSHVVLEATSAPHAGQFFEAILCAAKPATGESSSSRAVPLHIALTERSLAASSAMKAVARNLQVLNAVPLDKRIQANTIVGSFKVRQVTNLSGSVERQGLCLLMSKTGGTQDLPVQVSFDARALVANAGGGQNGFSSEWNQKVGDAALASVDPLVVLEDVDGDRDHEWSELVSQRCLTLGMAAPRVQVSRPMGPSESKYDQWLRLRPSGLLHCLGNEADAPAFSKEGAATIRRTGDGPILPPRSLEAWDVPRHRVVVLDSRRCSSAQDRKHWLEVGGLRSAEVIAAHFDVSEQECLTRVVQRGARHLNGERATQYADAQAELRPVSERLEPPTDREGFRYAWRLKAGGGVPATAAGRELVRWWVDEERAELPATVKAGDGAGYQDPQDESDNEAAPGSLPTLNQWIEVAEQNVPIAESWTCYPAGGAIDGVPTWSAGGAQSSTAVPAAGAGHEAEGWGTSMPYRGEEVLWTPTTSDADRLQQARQAGAQAAAALQEKRRQLMAAGVLAPGGQSAGVPPVGVDDERAGAARRRHSPPKMAPPPPPFQGGPDLRWDRAVAANGRLRASLEPSGSGDEDMDFGQEQLAATLRCLDLDDS